MGEAIILSNDDLAGKASMSEYVDVVAQGFRQRGEGATSNTPNWITGNNPDRTMIGYMAQFPEFGVMGSLQFTLANDVHYMAVLHNLETGAPVAVMDGASWNIQKTGAVGAVSVDALAREDASTVGLLGSSRVARGVLRATAEVRELTTVEVYSRTPENRESFASEMDNKLDADVRAVDSSTEAVQDCDILLTATTAHDPIVRRDEIADGTHVCAMGAEYPKREFGADTIKDATYVVDHIGRIFPGSAPERLSASGVYLEALQEGEINESHAHGELGEVVAGSVPGRTSDNEITFFDSSGTAIESISAAYMLYEKAKEQDLGTTMPVAPIGEIEEGVGQGFQ